MHYANVKTCTIENGVGVRTSLFVSGCTHRCKNCFNREAWDFEYGKPFDEEAQAMVIDSLRPAYVKGLTVLGGEPMEPANQRALLPFLRRVREELPDKTVWMYTGDVYEELLDGPRTTEVTKELLGLVDVLVDGPFVDHLKDITLKFRGSSNQRIIDLDATRATGVVTAWHDQPIFEQSSMGPRTYEALNATRGDNE
jgi:anaerobic ribonucleoside-triphosphate reductase activating protein